MRREPKPVEPPPLLEVLTALEDSLRRPGKPDHIAAAKAQLFFCLSRHLEVIEAKALTSKLLNLYLARRHFRSKDVVVRSHPVSVVLDPSNSCNLACPGCVHSAHAKESQWFDWKPGLLSATRFAALLDSYGPAALYLTLFNYGEPTINPETPQFIRYAKSHLLRTILSTNLSLPRFDAQAYVESGLDSMVLSIDGATQQVYQRFRRKGNLDLVFRNIRKLVEAKRHSGKSTPVITWRYLIFEHNLHEIPAALETARELGVDQFKAEPAWSVSWDDPEIRAVPTDRIDIEFGLDVFTALRQNFNPFPARLNVAAIDREFAREIDFAPDDTASAPGSTCEWLYKNVTMDAGGRIFPCCCSPQKDAALIFAEFDPANAPAADVFNSAMHRQARQFLRDPQTYHRHPGSNNGADTHPYCLDCEFDHSAFPHPSQVENYFATASADIFDASSLDLLSAW